MSESIVRQMEEEGCDYPTEGGEKNHRDVEPRHDKEIHDAVLKDRSHQPVHARLAVVRLELQDEDDKANEGNKVYRNVSFLGRLRDRRQ